MVVLLAPRHLRHGAGVQLVLPAELFHVRNRERDAQWTGDFPRPAVGLLDCDAGFLAGRWGMG